MDDFMTRSEGGIAGGAISFASLRLLALRSAPLRLDWRSAPLRLPVARPPSRTSVYAQSASLPAPRAARFSHPKARRCALGTPVRPAPASYQVRTRHAEDSGRGDQRVAGLRSQTAAHLHRGPGSPGLPPPRRGGGRLRAAFEVAKEFAGDDQALDFAGAFADGAELDVAVELFGGVILEEAVAAVNLHALVGGAHRGFAGIELGHRRLAGDGAALILEPGGAAGEQAGRSEERR